MTYRVLVPSTTIDEAWNAVLIVVPIEKTSTQMSRSPMFARVAFSIVIWLVSEPLPWT